MVERPIVIFETIGGEKRILRVIGSRMDGAPVNVEYMADAATGIGHYRRADGVDVTPSGVNNCLFDVVASATGFDGKMLRNATANVMLNRIERVANDMSHQRFAERLTGGQKPTQRQSRPASRNLPNPQVNN